MTTGTVAFGVLGSHLDSPRQVGRHRWSVWRPTVSLFRHPELRIDRFELLYQRRFTKLCNQVVADIRFISPWTEVVLNPISFRDPWDFEEVFGVLLDFAEAYSFDQDEEDYLVHITTGTHVIQICEFLLTEARYFPARLIQTAPPRKSAKDFPGSYHIIDLDLSRYDRLAARFRKRIADDISLLKSGIETRNPEFNALIARIERVAVRSREPILLTGPTGAGKSRLAARIFDLKAARGRVNGRFVEINCATVKGDAAMSALFGHCRGAYTGALADREGLLRAAHNGVLFLDEIGELGLDEQALLLRAIEEKTFLPLGADREQHSDFQLICGTNRDLGHLVREGRFREDLLSRINLWTFDLPGLAQRVEDIEPNLDYELDRVADRTGIRVTINREARRGFLGFAVSPQAAWRANFRDLSAAVTRMATLAPGGRINLDIVREEMGRLAKAWADREKKAEPRLITRVLGRDAAAGMDLFEAAQLEAVLKVCLTSASLAQAGRRLFAVSRAKRKTTNDSDRLRKYLARFGLAWRDLDRLSPESVRH